MTSEVSLQSVLIELGVVDASFSFAEHAKNGDGALIRDLAGALDLNEAEILAQLAAHLKIGVLDLDDSEVASKCTPDEFAPHVENSALWKLEVAPLWRERGGRVVVATTNPYCRESKKSLEFALNASVRPVLVEHAKLTRFLTTHFPAQRLQFDTLGELDNSDYVELLADGFENQEIDLSEMDAPPIVRLVNKIISDAATQRASDIHIEPRTHSLEVRFRIDGVMTSILDIPKRLQPYLISRVKIISGMDISERRRPQDGGLHVRVAGAPIDLRVSSLPTPHGEKIVLRLLRQDALDLTLGSLGVSNELERTVLRVLDKKGKLFLVTGPTGSGKTTLLYTALNYLHDGRKNIQTVEDPIEYEVGGVNQVQVNSAAGVTFASALRSILRQDPDVIMIGEIRDGETADIALQAAQTGHFVLSTLHTNDAPSAVARLLNLGADPFLIASALEGVIAQRLVRKLCSSCRAPAAEDYLDRFSDILGHFSKADRLFMPIGCDECHQTGFVGRTGVFSYLTITPKIEELIHQKASVAALETEARNVRFQTISDAAIQLVQRGVTALEEIAPYLYEEACAISAQAIPKAAPSEPRTPEQQPVIIETKKEEKSSHISRPRVLLIEDDPDVRTVLAMMLEKELYEVVEAENGKKALEEVYETLPTVILCDLMMPVMDGKEFLVRMQGNDQTRDIPIVMLTAADDERNEVELLNLGADDFVSKTASSEVILSRLRRATK